MSDFTKEVDRRRLEGIVEALQDNPDLLLKMKTLLGLNTVTFPNEIFVRVKNETL